jgi:hypothetical protein
MLHRKYLFILLLFPFVSYAEGQNVRSFFLDKLMFMKILGLWLLTVFLIIYIINKLKKEKLSLTYVLAIYIITGLIAMFIWSLVKL